MEPIVFLGGVVVFAGVFWCIEDFVRDAGLQSLLEGHTTKFRRSASRIYDSFSGSLAARPLVGRSGTLTTDAPTSFGGSSVAARICTRR